MNSVILLFKPVVDDEDVMSAESELEEDGEQLVTVQDDSESDDDYDD